MDESTLKLIISAIDNASSPLNKIKGVLNDVNKSAGGLAQDGLNKITTAGKTMVTGLMIGLPLLGGLIGGVALKAGQAQAQVQTMGVALETSMGGNIDLAQEAQKNITDFASKTPYELGEVMTAFIKLKNMGLDPGNRALTAYGDTASAMGKPLNDMIEAVADAATGEFERLKEFGIRASSQGDNVSLTFKGVTTTVKKNAEEIENYLINLGQTNFSGGMAKQSKTLAGLYSTLSDTISLKLAGAFDKIGGTTAVTYLFENLISTIEGFDVNYWVDGFGSLYELLSNGNFNGKLFGIGEDSPTLDMLLNIRGAILDIYDIFKEGELISGDGLKNFFNEDQINIIESTVQSIRNFWQEINKSEATTALLVGLATMVGVTLVAGFISLGIAIATATWPIIAIGIAVAGLYYAWQTNMGGIQQIWQQVSTLIVSVYEGMIKPQFAGMQSQLAELWTSFMTLWQLIEPTIMPMLSALGAIIGVVIVGYIMVLITYIRTLMNVWKVVFDFLINTINNFKTIWQGVTNFVVGVITGDWSRAFNGLKGIATGVFNQIVNVAKSSFRLIASPLNSMIETYNKANDTLGLPDINPIPSFATGVTNFGGGVAKVHKDELITMLPKGANVYTREESKDLLGGGSAPLIGSLSIGSYMGTDRDKRNMAEDLLDSLILAAKARGIDINKLKTV